MTNKLPVLTGKLCLTILLSPLLLLSAPQRGDEAAKGIVYTDELAPSAADYVSSGLVALCDGEENDGWGIHNNSLKGWRNLVTDSLFPSSYIGTPYYWEEKCLVSDGASGWGKVPFYLPDSLLPVEIATATYTTEMVYESENTGIFMQHPSTNNRFEFMLTQPTICSVSVVVENGVVAASYINGKATTSADGITFTPRSVQAAATILYGGWYKGSIKGNLYSIRLYAVALTDEEIRYNYLIDRLRFNLP